MESNFFELLNNANFGFDFRNSANNAKFEPIIDEINEKKKRKLTKGVKTKLDDSFKKEKIKSMIDFDQNECNSIKSIVVIENTIID